MKIKILFVFFMIYSSVNAQLENINTFKTDELGGDITFKIKSEKYKTDFKTFFLKDKINLLENASDDILHFMVYKKKYLFVGYYPNTQEQQLSGIGYEIRSLEKLRIIDLEDPSNKWDYQFNSKTAMGLIKDFNPKDGDIVYCNHIKPIKDK
jgi:hypothetical protein